MTDNGDNTEEVEATFKAEREGWEDVKETDF